MGLAPYIGMCGIILRIQRVEVLIEVSLGRDPGIDGAAHLLTRMQQHVLDDGICTLAVLYDLVEIALPRIRNLADLYLQPITQGILMSSRRDRDRDRDGVSDGSQTTSASRIRIVIASGCEISARWLASISIVFAPIRLAMKRSRSGLIVRSCVETA